ncbi:unnamed protein product [Strongylus vulgaris]|uniref:Uncharacterized protein n=1 Tax=Strongylus vulgaris TaxID=40348 RepID=A0A3P7LBP7_STRVU|nr:unnamed protein product [Strongylus vulgaris]
MVITASIQPNNEQGGPQIVGFVLEPSMLDLEHPDPPNPPRYEDALKLVSAPPRYEEQSTGSSSPVRSIDLPPSGRTTARIESSVDEMSSNDGEGEEDAQDAMDFGPKGHVNDSPWRLSLLCTYNARTVSTNADLHVLKAAGRINYYVIALQETSPGRRT